MDAAVTFDAVAVARLVAAVESRLAAGQLPVIVALDGRSGSGKSTLAEAVRARLASCSVIEGDSFYAGGTAELWDSLDAAGKAAHVFDWRRQRSVLESLRAGHDASWFGFDWDSFDDRWCDTPAHAAAASVVILEGAYSARPELADLLDLRVLLDVDDDRRLAQLARREGDTHRDEWFGRWSEAEVHYFGVIMPPEAFDLVV